MWRMREKSLSVHGDYGKTRMVCIYKVVSEYVKSN
jgi:hypothetical protein